MNFKSQLFLGLSGVFIAYSFFIYTLGTEISSHSEKINSKVTEGKILFQKHNCISCHQIYGLGGYLGPELTTVISQQGKGERYAKVFLESGTQRMPNFHFTDEEINSIIEFLKYVDATASTYKVPNE